MEIKGKIFDFIYRMAMRDATMMKAYEGENKKELFRISEARDIVKKYADKVIEGCYTTDSDKHEKEFCETAQKVCKAINKSKDFNFGNAQKLINMTVKYLYAGYYENEYLRENFKYCHCPMDRVMLEYVWKEYGDKEKLNKGIEKGKFKAGWGQEKWENGNLPQRYCNFQIAVRELAEERKLYPIEYDYYIWN